MSYRKKLIEVGLPLEAINKASGREKSIRHGHPSTFHLWWARRPLAAARAIIFSQIVDDPSSCPDEFPTIEEQREERKRLFRLIEELVEWSNTNNQRILSSARREIALSVARGSDLATFKKLKSNLLKDGEIDSFLVEKAPRLHDPFAGGGSIPLEAGRLGLNVVATDLNPVAVLINRAQLEIPRRWAGASPVNPKGKKNPFVSAEGSIYGLIDDVQYYAARLMAISRKKLKKHYPPIIDRSNSEREIIAWVWVRTVPSPDPVAKGAYVPLADSFWLSQKKTRKWWVRPCVDKKKLKIEFEVKSGSKMTSGDLTGTKLGRGAFKCLFTGATITPEYIREMGKQGSIKARLMAIAVDGSSGREYFSPTKEQEDAALSVGIPEDIPNTDLPEAALGFRIQNYGITKHSDLFSARQLKVLCTFSDLIADIHDEILEDCQGVRNSDQYSRDIITLLVLGIGKLANRTSSQCFWDTGGENVQQVFARQALPMIWTFAEGNPFSNSSGNWMGQIEFLCKAMLNFPTTGAAFVQQYDACKIADLGKASAVISTDPPYYDNVGYADLSDFFYIWLRKAGGKIIKDVFRTVLTPKEDEIIAEPARHESKETASKFFEERLGEALRACDERSLPNYPVTIYYAFKQSESSESSDSDDGMDTVSSTGWETFLNGVLKANFRICGTYPIRTEQASGLRQVGRNALASSVVLVCRAEDRLSKSISRREFVTELKRELPIAIRNLQDSGLAAVDLQQAAIGPGMAVFSKYISILESDDSPMSIRSALVLINQILDEVLVDSDSTFDSQTRWAITWFETYGYKVGPFGEANTLAQAKNIGMESMVNAGLISSKSGKVALVHHSKLKDGIDPEKEIIPFSWLQLHYLIKALEVGGEDEAAVFLRKFATSSGQIRDLAYRCFSICEKNGWAQEGLSFNNLVTSWSEIQKQSRLSGETQASFEV